MTIANPRLRSSSSMDAVWSWSSMRTVSVISNCNVPACRPARAVAPAMCDRMSRCLNCRAERLTLMVRSSPYRDCHALSRSVAVSITHSPIVLNHAGLFGEVNECIRSQKAEVGVLPPDQGLEPDDLEILQAEDRLVVQHEFATVDRRADIRVQRHRLRARDRQRGLEDDELTSALRLRVIESSICHAQEVRRAGAGAAD